MREIIKTAIEQFNARQKFNWNDVIAEKHIPFLVVLLEQELRAYVAGRVSLEVEAETMKREDNLIQALTNGLSYSILKSGEDKVVISQNATVPDLLWSVDEHGNWIFELNTENE